MKTNFTIIKHFKHIFGAAALFLASSSFAQTTVFDVIAGSPDHNYLEAALVQEGLDAVLSDGSAEFTVFAPTDASFDALAAALGTDINGILALPNLTDVLTYHVVGATVPAAAVTNGAIVDAVSTTNTLKLTKTAAGSVYANQAMVVAADLNADNGVVHATDGVLLPFETVVDVAIDNGFTSLAASVIYAELMPVLTNPLASYTVFAPTDEAFEALAAWVGVSVADLLTEAVTPPEFLADVLAYHVLGAPVLAAELSNGAIVAPVSQTNTLKVTVKGSGEAFVNQAQITATDIACDNGVVHVLDGVLIPFETVVDVAIDNGFSTLATAVITAELLPALSDPYNLFTVFAPTNDAFDALATALDTDLAGILALPNLADVLLYHVVAGPVTAADLVDGPVPTLNGSDVVVDLTNGVMINDAMVTTADVFSDNGVVHIIDGVLLPPNLGVNEMSNTPIEVYPNPAVNSIQFSSDETFDFSIVNTLGQVVSNGKTSNQNISVSDLKDGMYTLVLSNAAGTKTSKFFKK
ncbi:MAG: fasciclin domain-containing protein [Crocinitomicaceae bacterium]|nr:fasciclin domain-containing protein [Crocinitomicaceae bacterium]